jgi:hypothetical protein
LKRQNCISIPAFYAALFANRLKEGFVCVRNPYNPNQVSRYCLDPSVVDVIGFCTKNPAPMFPYMDLLREYGQYWFVTITPYGRDIEPNVPDKHGLLEAFKKLSELVGVDGILFSLWLKRVAERDTSVERMPFLLKAPFEIKKCFKMSCLWLT